MPTKKVPLSAEFSVAGTAWHRDAVAGLRVLEQIRLEREPDNTHDPNAIKVVCVKNRAHIGYVPAVSAASMAPLMDESPADEITGTVEEVYRFRKDGRFHLGVRVKIFVLVEDDDA